MVVSGNGLRVVVVRQDRGGRLPRRRELCVVIENLAAVDHVAGGPGVWMQIEDVISSLRRPFPSLPRIGIERARTSSEVRVNVRSRCHQIGLPIVG